MRKVLRRRGAQSHKPLGIVVVVLVDRDGDEDGTRTGEHGGREAGRHAEVQVARQRAAAALELETARAVAAEELGKASHSLHNLRV